MAVTLAEATQLNPNELSKQVFSEIVILSFWMDVSATSLTQLLVALAGTVSVLLSIFTAPR